MGEEWKGQPSFTHTERIYCKLLLDIMVDTFKIEYDFVYLIHFVFENTPTCHPNSLVYKQRKTGKC